MCQSAPVPPRPSVASAAGGDEIELLKGNVEAGWRALDDFVGHPDMLSVRTDETAPHVCSDSVEWFVVDTNMIYFALICQAAVNAPSIRCSVNSPLNSGPPAKLAGGGFLEIVHVSRCLLNQT